MNRRILFVDDEPRVLDGLRRMLHPLRKEWHMEFAASGREALQILTQAPCDVLVTALQMPEMDGAKLLEEVRLRHPRTVRIILSGEAGRESMVRAVKAAHRQLDKPCDADTLKATVLRACALQDVLANDALQSLVSRIHTLPSLPAMYYEVVRELESPEPSLQKVGRIIAQDVGMTVKILQVVNSSLFGIRRHVASPMQAVSLLGLETIRTLVLAAGIFCKVDPAVEKLISVDALWAHSQASSRLAGLIAQAEGTNQKVIECACLAGMLHDTGKLVLASQLPEQYREALDRVQREKVTQFQVEREMFKATHAEIGAYLLGLWGLPQSIVEVVAWHHNPAESPEESFSPLLAVHVANALSHEASGQNAGKEPSQLDMPYLERIGLSDRVPRWREIGKQP